MTYATLLTACVILVVACNLLAIMLIFFIMNTPEDIMKQMACFRHDWLPVSLSKEDIMKQMARFRQDWLPVILSKSDWHLILSKSDWYQKACRKCGVRKSITKKEWVDLVTGPSEQKTLIY